MFLPPLLLFLSLFPALLPSRCCGGYYSYEYTCSTTRGTFLYNSIYDHNLRLLIAGMKERTPINMRFTASQGVPPDEVFGSAFCNNTRSPTTCSTCADPLCSDCMDGAITILQQYCGNVKTAWGSSSNCGIYWGDSQLAGGSSPPPPSSAESSPPQAPEGLVESPPPPPSTSFRNPSPPSATSGKKAVPAYKVAVPVVLSLFTAVGVLFLFLLFKRRSAMPSWRQPQLQPQQSPSVLPRPVPALIDPARQSLVFDYQILKRATNNFAKSNLLGRGGFGPVYKGTLHGGQEIAVKKLEGGLQGIDELETEVRIVTELRHKNLVTVLGYCVEGEEAMLVYEFLPNASLDRFIIDTQRRERLQWSARFKIIKGISRGLQYLHEDSKVSVVHRDLKTSNILLDADMNPKISDFGLARLFNDSQTRAFTMKIAGTKGYMAPEYLREGIYSLKADVYSFGIIILEIVTGKLVTSVGPGRGLLDHVIRHWNAGNPLQALDSCLGGVCSPDEVTTSVYVGLLCSQEDRNERPAMEAVVGMLSNPQSMSQISESSVSCQG